MQFNGWYIIQLSQTVLNEMGRNSYREKILWHRSLCHNIIYWRIPRCLTAAILQAFLQA